MKRRDFLKAGAMGTLGTMGTMALGVSSRGAHAQSRFPDKPIRLVIPFAAGGSTDIIGRIFAQRASQILGQPVVLDIKPGAGGAIGSADVARSKPDGYTMLYGASSTHVFTPATQSVPYDPIKDFQHLAIITQQPAVIAVNNEVPVRTQQELIAYIKANPGKVSFASAGEGSLTHIAGELFNKLAGTDMLHVPYKGVGALTTDWMANRVQVYPGSSAGVVPLHKSGRVRLLSVCTDTRLKSLSEYPTAIEAGLPGMVIGSLNFFCAAAGTPKSIVDVLYSTISKIINDKSFQDELVKQGAEPVTDSNPESAARALREQFEKLGPVARAVTRASS